ncbi:hypothetical protein F5878DRAFT_722110 [Lentinula raphanica]|uniref:BRCT domain-containing protein n=1 Tax=Lentinula raphanica TaxID=153919 RepID=A0AA38PGM9_9AGAR|nr:hypothetical protein F5878DRAFT_722110 [Lentinula raphanica]
MDASLTENPGSNLYLFTDPSSGHPLPIFVEDLPNGAQLVNQLRAHGARILPTPHHAQIIITDIRLYLSGINVERPNEAKLLDQSWVGKCIVARRLFLEGDSWGACAINNYNSGFFVPQTHFEQFNQPFNVDSQFLPPRVMRRQDHPTASTGSSDNHPTLPPIATTPNGIIPLTPLSHSSTTPTSSRGNTAEPAMFPHPQQDGHPYPTQNNPHFGNFMPTPWMQAGAAMPQAMPNPQLLQQMFMNPTLVMAVADAYYRANLQLTALSQGHQVPYPIQAPQQPFPAPNMQAPINPALASTSALPSFTQTENPATSNNWPSSPSSKELSSNDKGKRKALSPPRSPSSEYDPRHHATVLTLDGKSLKFYVQVDLKNRSELVSEIKKNGGSTTNEIQDADYAVLSSKSRYLAELLHAAKASKTPAVRTLFIRDCIEEGKILPHSGYLLAEPTTRKPGRPSYNDASPSKKPRSETTRKEPSLSKVPTAKQRSTSDTVKKETTKATSTASPSTVKLEKTRDNANNNKEREKLVVKKHSSSAIGKRSEISSRIPSPPPPPESTRVLNKGGRYSYSPAERAFVETYVKILFERDHLTSNTKIAKELHRKMPHHTIRSWNTTVGGQLRETIENARKRAGIAYRKRAAHAGDKPGPQQSPAEERDKPAKRPKLSDEELRNRDIELIAKFFADGEANDLKDEDRDTLWARIHKKGNWRSPSSWEAFYEEIHEEVKQRFSALTGQPME